MDTESSVSGLSAGPETVARLFCIISGELILIIQCMKIRFIETFIKAFRVDLISTERDLEVRWKSDLSVTCPSFSNRVALLGLAFLLCSWGWVTAFACSGGGMVSWRHLLSENGWPCLLSSLASWQMYTFYSSRLLCCLGNKLQGFSLFDK